MYGKKINGKTYYYLRQMGWVDGKPKMVSERYLGSAADIAPRETPGPFAAQRFRPVRDMPIINIMSTKTVIIATDAR